VSDVAIREGTAADVPALRRLVAETMGDPDAGVDPVAPRRSGDVVFVAELAGHPAGYAAARVDGAVLVVDRVVVAPADRGRRVGNRLLDWLEGYGVARGLRRVRIAVEPGNRAAQEFYGRRGYAACVDAVERDLPAPVDRAE
jgi:ribosomal protein S18 acetylase RimI-like enzyme